MTPAQWIETFHPKSGAYAWQSAYAVVVIETKRLLSELPEQAALTTTELVERLFPQDKARGLGVDTRTHLFHVLHGLARRHSFDGWIDTSERKRLYGQNRAVFKWHKNGAILAKREVQCPVCDHKFPLEP